ncbi:hypothetical protein DV515_00003976 [Chloebia gouldiae]|uniref:Uncharacterized protein n=1 Tax=Chloebia gouldiae TaxID=44316 RepID=A0A3L8SR87_CHLGU|nr:hypothetical protein DV515_00003976 [Chloebia gouldiae]
MPDARPGLPGGSAATSGARGALPSGSDAPRPALQRDSLCVPARRAADGVRGGGDRGAAAAAVRSRARRRVPAALDARSAQFRRA